MIKFRLYFDKDKEIEWLNEMSQKGWAMKSYAAGFYTFEPCAAGQYLYQVDYVGGLFHLPKSYRDFMEDTGVEIVAVWGPWAILRKYASEGEFELYTDVESKLEQYTKIKKMFQCVLILELVAFAIEIVCGLTGALVGYAFAVLILAFITCFVNLIQRTNITIEKLKMKSEAMGEPSNPRYISAFLISGLLLNSVSMFCRNIDEIKNLRLVAQCCASLLIIIGIVCTFRGLHRLQKDR